ncbi:hypothetical protein [Thomasclavelia cocleata]|uniref:hypothetical protein n=1 Tax=Thomasclavelia cocleata TaxID=69824 RepID=UPI00242E03AA|nr:hypothetical protein [Thomasclavelia cocleata]MCI9131268.1 hypothetical protein [Thomasclavelia cocleata]
MKKLKLSVVLVGVIFLMTGCKDANSDIAKEQVVDFLDGYKQKNEEISEFLLGSTEADSMDFDGISAYFADEMEYKIKSCKKKEENLYNVEVEVQTLDFEQVFSDSYQETVKKYGEEGIAENFLGEMEENVKEGKYETNKVVCNIVVRKLNDEFKIQMDSSFANALTGGMNEYLSSLQKGK